MKTVALITNISPDVISGGFSAMNRAMYDHLSKDHTVDYIGPVDPKPDLQEKVLSKAGRSLKLGGAFYFFSRKRLDVIRREVEARLEKSKAEFAVFHGFTPWIQTRPKLPYIAWSDCTFAQYVRIYHDSKIFRAHDLNRIQESEAIWLQRARRVIFRSQWAAAEAIRDYHLAENRVGVVGNYGFLTPPPCDTYAGARDFLMITTNFRQKGGPVALKAFRLIHKDSPEVRLILVGDYPGREALQEPGVSYLGWIDKTSSLQTELLAKALAGARCLVHPTVADTNPMVLIESGYFGCPAISTKRNAIPELVKNGISGLLLEDPTDVAELVKAMKRILQCEEDYQQMRKEARSHVLQHYSREAFQGRLSLEIDLPPKTSLTIDRRHFSNCKPEINYITNLMARNRSGGFSAMNTMAFRVLQNCGDVQYVGPVNPPVHLKKKILSKAVRSLGLQGDFSFFTPQRLNRIASEVESLKNTGARLDFYHGFTPWISIVPTRPYMAWSDCTFHDYIQIFHRRADFQDKDLARIEEAEAAWLQKCERVFFTSRWAADRAIAAYRLNPAVVKVLGIFGEMDLLDADMYSGSRQFAFISTNFPMKGGPVVMEAFLRVRRNYPSATLVIVGDKPDNMSNVSGVSYAGFLRKENPAELEAFKQILATSRALVHPTKSDITPLLLAEAAYFGCPVISSRRFAIPEIVEDGKTGVLLDNPENVDLVQGAMEAMLVNEGKYSLMREAARKQGHEKLTKAMFSKKLSQEINIFLDTNDHKAFSDESSNT